MLLLLLESVHPKSCPTAPAMMQRGWHIANEGRSKRKRVPHLAGQVRFFAAWLPVSDISRAATTFMTEAGNRVARSTFTGLDSAASSPVCARIPDTLLFRSRFTTAPFQLRLAPIRRSGAPQLSLDSSSRIHSLSSSAVQEYIVEASPEDRFGTSQDDKPCSSRP